MRLALERQPGHGDEEDMARDAEGSRKAPYTYTRGGVAQRVRGDGVQRAGELDSDHWPLS
jgi:hypothetical protein